MVDAKAGLATKEKFYRNISFILSGLVWVMSLLLPIYAFMHPYFPLLKTFIIIALVLILAFLIVYWISRAFFKGYIARNALRVNERQFGEIYKIVLAIAKKMGIERLPPVFMVQEEGWLNDLAIRFHGHTYVVLRAPQVYQMLEQKADKELHLSIARELMYHLPDRSGFWKRLFISPAMLMPFLGKAYKRARSLTSLAITGDLEGSLWGLISSLVAGSDASAKAAGGWRLSGISGPLADRAVELTSAPLIIGRDPNSCNLIIPAARGEISRQHCLVRFAADGAHISLEDLGSKNGTFLSDGRRLQTGVPYPLQPGDRFYLAQPGIMFELQRH
jgi:hypothetical protein